MKLGNSLFHARKKAGFSQEEVAEKLGVSRQTVSKWETDETLPDIRQSKKMAVMYHVSLDDFIKADIEEMRKIVDKDKIREFNIMSYIFLAEILIVMISAYPLFSLDGYIGVVIWVLFFMITFATAAIIEKFKKNNDIQTYKEIIAFVENKPLTYEESQREIGKRIYQKILLALLAGVITLITVIIVMVVVNHI